MLGALDAPAVQAESRPLVPMAVDDLDEALSAPVRAHEQAQADDDHGEDDSRGDHDATNDSAPKHDSAPARSHGKAAARANQKRGSNNTVAALSRPAKRPVKSHRAGDGASIASLGRQPDATYRRIRDGWHAAVVTGVQPEPLAELQMGHPPLVLAPVNGGERATVMPEREDGGFTLASQRSAARALAPVRRSKPHPIAPRLLDLVYRAMRHFHAPFVHVISGYRADRPGSRHTQGRAMDFVVPGTSNEQLAAYVREFGFVGVGVYPKSGFVHLDVRPESFFWLDNSLPNERCVTQQILAKESKRVDDAARARGESPDFFVPNNEREDRAAARAYKRRAQQRRAAVQSASSLAGE